MDKTLNELVVKALSLKTRVALLGAPLGNQNAAGPHDGTGDNFPRVSGGGSSVPSIDKMRAALDKIGVSHAHIGKERPLLHQRSSLVSLLNKHKLNPDDYSLGVK